ncbi:MAG TPA: hypothetical protein V6D23_01060 [Candidatus Obscuribacterales bacterium]
MTGIPPLKSLIKDPSGTVNQTAPNIAPGRTPTIAGTQPATSVSLSSDTLRTSGTQPTAAIQTQLETVKTQFSPQAPALNPAEIRRLLAGPQTLSKIQSLIQRQPRLAENFARPGGDQVLKLIQTAATRRLNSNEIKLLQRYLVEQEHAAIAYRGHATGIDGDYGRLTHSALVGILSRPLTQPTQPAPAQPAPVEPAQPAPDQSLEPETPPEPIKVADLLVKLQQPGQSLEQLAALIGQLADADRDKLTSLGSNEQNLGSLLAQAAERPLSKTERKAVQTLLVQAGQELKYPGHATGIDGNFGNRSQQALVRVVSQLLTGQAPAPARPYLQYERMLADHLLDITMAVGYDEGTVQYQGANHAEESKLIASLEARGFSRDDARAKELLKAAGKEAVASYAALYVKENVSSQDGQPVHAIVRVVQAGDGSQGAANRQAAIEGMNQSDVFAYGGHGRYGNGPDFDRNFTVTIDWTGVAGAPASGQVVYDDYEHLKSLIGGNDATAIAKIKELEKAGKLSIQRFNDGNIRMNENPLHSGEFGAQLTSRAVGAVPNTLAKEIKGDQYKLWLFEACRTRDFVSPIRAQARSNTALNARNLDLLTTEQVMYWQNTGKTMLALLDGVLAKDSAPDLLNRVKAANPEQALIGATHSFHGLEDNPRQ